MFDIGISPPNSLAVRGMWLLSLWYVIYMMDKLNFKFHLILTNVTYCSGQSWEKPHQAVVLRLALVNQQAGYLHHGHLDHISNGASFHWNLTALAFLVRIESSVTASFTSTLLSPMFHIYHFKLSPSLTNLMNAKK